MIKYSFLQTKFGQVLIASVQEGVCYIGLPGCSAEAMKSWCKKNIKADIFLLTPEWNREAEKQISEYSEGKRKNFTFTVFHMNTEFRKRVLEAVRQIPYGHTASYGEIARRIGNPRASRAVGSANSNNPLPLFYPCHRVIAGSGSLGGFGGAPELKQALLDMEKQHKPLI